MRLAEPPPSAAVGAAAKIFVGAAKEVVRRAVVIGNGAAGAESQCLGLVRALGLGDNYNLYRISRPKGGVNQWLRWLPVPFHKRLESVVKLFNGSSLAQPEKKVMPLSIKDGKKFCLLPVREADAYEIAALARETYDKFGPLLVVASGRDTIPIARSIKGLVPENVFVIQVQNPRSHLDRFDLVITPQHDCHALTPVGKQDIPWLFRHWLTPTELLNKNVVFTVGALHRADSDALRLAAATWHGEMAPIPKPLLVVNIGGPTRYCCYGADLAKELVASLQNVLPSCGTVRISFSRRTPSEVSQIILKEFRKHSMVYIWDGKDPNPHLGHLAWADAFIITADSVSMLSEACSTGKPVYVIGAERCKRKFAAFHQILLQRGAVRPFTGREISYNWSYPSLNDALVVRNRVIEALAECGWTL